MRIERLSYLRYGPFSDTELRFRPGAALHVVYGPNEAGKSSALSGLSDLFFGFPRSTAHFNFRHEAKTLRLSAEIVTRDGQRLAFRRRRGTKDTLLADSDDETPLRDDCLAPFCGALTRPIFERAFALDARRLEEGGAAMLSAEGEIGSLLFSAASGLLGLADLRRRIEEEAERIYAPRRSAERSLYQAMDRHEAARRAEREQELRAGEWKTLLAAEARLAAELAALDAERLATRHRLDALSRLERLHPLLADIDAAAALLALDADLDRWPKGAAGQLAAALAAEREGLAALAPAEDHCRLLEARLAGRVIDAAALAAGPEIAALAGLKGADETYRRDLPRVRAELAQREQQLETLARQLGFADAAALEAITPGLATLDSLRLLAEEGQELLARSAALARQRAEAEATLAALADSGRAGRLIDPRPWQKQLEALQPDLARAAEEDRAAARLAEAAAAEAAAIARLLPPLPPGADVLTLPLPETSEIADAERQLAATAQALAAARAAVAQQERERQALVVERTGIDREGEIVTAAEIRAARGRRDATVAALVGGTSAGLDRLPAEIAEADRLADLAQTSAERIARHATLTLAIERLDVTLAALMRDQAAAETAHHAAEAGFAALFAAAGIVPLEPGRMQIWRRAIEDLRRAHAALAVERETLSAARETGARLLPLLRDMAEAVGTAGALRLPLAALARALGERLADLARHWDDQRLAEGRRVAEEQRLARLGTEAATLEAAVAAWGGRFDTALPALGLPPGTPPDTVLRALDAFRRVPELRQQREELSRRVRGIEREIAGFEVRVAGLVATVAPTLAGQPVAAMVIGLEQRAEAARLTAQQRATDEESLAAARLAEARAARMVAEARASMAALLGEATMAPEELQARLAERDRRQAALEAARDRLAAQFPGLSEAAARAELAGEDLAALALEIEALRERQESEVQQHGQLRSELDRQIALRKAREEGPSAEQAGFAKQAAEAEARALARDWAVRKLAAGLLTVAMERFRESRASPLMLKAGAIFATLTGGRFVRLRQDLDGQDTIVLQAERATGETVPLSGLSEGTAHQLYLALRLAFLEAYAESNEPPPLICDDLFQSFDDQRTRHGIRALAEAATSFQTILLTHHQSVVEIARAELGERLDVIEL